MRERGCACLLDRRRRRRRRLLLLLLLLLGGVLRGGRLLQRRGLLQRVSQPARSRRRRVHARAQDLGGQRAGVNTSRHPGWDHLQRVAGRCGDGCGAHGRGGGEVGSAGGGRLQGGRAALEPVLGRLGRRDDVEGGRLRRVRCRRHLVCRHLVRPLWSRRRDGGLVNGGRGGGGRIRGRRRRRRRLPRERARLRARHVVCRLARRGVVEKGAALRVLMRRPAGGQRGGALARVVPLVRVDVGQQRARGPRHLWLHPKRAELIA
mmetsp:Transcript_22137/g.74753  ORF Transcript_22137/g.74753 Transcript_22137/m.74753 type:complete len:263 (+) Transcript_22137:84-872(+)